MENAVVVIAGSGAVLIDTMAPPGSPDDGGPIRLSDRCHSYEEARKLVQRAERTAGLGPAAAFPFAIVLDELCAAGFPLSRVYVGRRAGPHYYSDRNALYWPQDAAAVSTFGGAEHADIFGGSTFSSEKLEAFVRGIPEGRRVVNVTAGDTDQKREKIARILDLAVDGLSFVPVHPSAEVYRIALPIVSANTTLAHPYGLASESGSESDPSGSAPAPAPVPPVILVATGRTTSHVARWTSAEVGEMVATMSVPRSVSVATPVFPSVLPRSGLFRSHEADAEVGRAAFIFAAAVRVALKEVGGSEPAEPSGPGGV